MRNVLAATIVACSFWLGSSSTVHPEFIADGFQDIEMFGIPNLSTDITWTPSGQLLVSSKAGMVWFYEDFQEGTPPFHWRTVVLDLRSVMCWTGDRGIISLTLHPDFENTRWIYIYYTYSENGSCDFNDGDGPVNRLSRFELPPSMVIDPLTEDVLLQTSSVPKPLHVGGATAFGRDGYLYIGTGDGGNYDPSQSLGTLWGKILRITDQGDIPSDNPFTPESGYTSRPTTRCGVTGLSPPGSPQDAVCLEIFSYGLRNPFNFAMDPSADGTSFLINDSGEWLWEETNVGGDGYEQANYGWPTREGPCEIDVGEGKKCQQPPAGLGFTDPIHWYNHGPFQAAVTGGAFVPNGVWSAEYDGAYIMADYKLGEIYHLEYTGNGCRNCSVPTSDHKQTLLLKRKDTEIVRMKFGPYYGDSQALYYTAQTDRGPKLRRLSFVGDDPHPQAVIDTIYLSPDGTSLTVQFDGTGSSSPPGESLSFLWDFGEDGSESSTSSVATHRYSSAGLFVATLTVTDRRGRKSVEYVEIDVDNEPKPLVSFPWSAGGSMGCPGDYDYCGMLEFCKDDWRYGYRLPCSHSGSCACNSGGPLIRLEAGKRYQLTLRNSAPDSSIPTNLHTHGLHIVGAGDSDDVTRTVSGGSCLDYTWNILPDHPGGTHWYHAHHHRSTRRQVEGGAFGMLIVEDNTNIASNVPEWAANELLLQVSWMRGVFLGNGNPYEIFNVDAEQWYRLRVSVVDSKGTPDYLRFTSGCDVHKVASDGIWHSSVPGPQGTEFELTGASRGDFAIRCKSTNAFVNIKFGSSVVAILSVGSVEPNPHAMGTWTPARPRSLQNMTAVSVPTDNMMDITIKPNAINEMRWNPTVALATIAYDQVHEWTIYHTQKHPFHLHLYHMLIVTPGGCGEHKEGEFYDTIASPVPCKVRFKASDFGQRCVLHCHLLFHEDWGAMAWVDVQGSGMPVYNVNSPSRTCAAGAEDEDLIST